jgi:hypothetical protein
MKSHSVHWRLALVAIWVSASWPVAAELTELNLGSVPTTGAAAVAGTRFREVTIVHTLACDDEINFLEAISHGEKTGDWPTTHLSAKAALLSRAFDTGSLPGVVVIADTLEPPLPDPAHPTDTAPAPRPLCFAAEADRDWRKWRRLYFDRGDKDKPWYEGAVERWKAIEEAPGDDFAKILKVQEELNRIYLDRFGAPCGKVTTPRTIGITQSVTIQLTRECLMSQIAAVTTNPKFGAWKIDEDGNFIPRLPGTSASKLPCTSEWALVNKGLAPSDWTAPWDKLEGVEGDSDMGVLSYTRLAHLLYRARLANPDLRADADESLRKLNEWLLTLRGGPASETYNVFWSCGNFENSFGTADDFLDDKDVYNEDTKRTVSGDEDGGRSFWEKLWKFLRFLLVAAAVGLAIGLAVGALFGFALAGAVAGATIAIVVAGGLIALATLFDISIEETENHILMQNSSIYLKNKLMMAEERTAGNKEKFDKLVDLNEDVRERLLERLQRIAEEDFLEYNAKPYNGLSLKSILNLVDYACDVSWDYSLSTDPPKGSRDCDAKDAAIVTAASAVYDLTAAKAALGSSQGRRMIPYRRLVEENLRYRDEWRTNDGGTINTHEPRHFLNLDAGADHMLAAQQFWSGVTTHGPNGRASSGSVHEMFWYATSLYRPHEMIIDLAIDKSVPYEQTLDHDTLERYSSGPGWLLTAGGDSEEEPQGLRFSVFGIDGLSTTWNNLADDNDKGVGVPTSLMANGRVARRDTYQDFLRFEGTKEDWGQDGESLLQSFSKNHCVNGTFACGLRFEIPPRIAACLRVAALPTPLQLRFITSAECPEYADGDENSANDFYLAVWRSDCKASDDDCGGKPWGFIEVARADDFGHSLTQYIDAVTAANLGNFTTWLNGEVEDEMKFWSVTQKREIVFTPDDEDFDADCRACGSIIRHESDSRFTINHPGRPGRIFIDLDDEKAPIRRGEGGVILATP